MVSGDIWQFNYPRTASQSIALFDPAAIERIAKHYKVDSAELLRSIRATANPSELRAPTLQPDATPEATHPPDASATALSSWQAAVVAGAGLPEELPADLMLFSLRASVYLANTRTAAYLWVKEKPEALTVLADEEYRSVRLWPFLTGQLQLSGFDTVSECLADQVKATRITAEAAQDLLMCPQGASGCGARRTSSCKQLSDSISVLATQRGA